MSLPIVLDVTIGLALMYLMMSLAVTTIGELIATAASLRAEHLSRTITMLIDDDDIRKRFYDHGLIVSSKTASRGGKAADGADESPDAGAEPRKPATDAAGVPKDKEHPSYFDSRVFAMALLDSLGASQTNPKPGSIAKSVADIRSLVEALPGNSKLRDVLLAQIGEGVQTAETLRDDVARWFDTAMDRLSGDYARQQKQVALAVGFALAVILNADSFSVARALWSDPALRASMVLAAGEVVDKGQLAAPTCPVEGVAPPDRLVCLVKAAVAQEDSLRPLPIGWDFASFGAWVAGWSGASGVFAAIGSVVLKIVGLAFTALALSLGAPFWFDLLQRFMSVRGTGPKPKARSGR